MMGWEPAKDEKLLAAVQAYLDGQGLLLYGDARFVAGIDYVALKIGDHAVLRIGLPPVSNYVIDETEHTSRYLRPINSVAV